LISPFQGLARALLKHVAMPRLTRRHLLPFALLVAAGCVDPLEGIEPTEGNVRFLTLNVGNPDSDEPNYPLRLRDQSYEDHVAARIAALRPDVVALQEVLPAHTCEAFEENDPTRTCFEHEAREPAIRRLLGPDYSIVCDMRLEVECVGVHIEFGTIVGLEAGGIDLRGATTPALPGPACNYAEGACSQDLCDAESTVSAVDVDTEWGRMRVVHMHPNASGFTGDGIFYLGNTCRRDQLEQGFSLAPEDVPTLMLGDWNFDPDHRELYDPEATVWDGHVGVGRRFSDHGQRDGFGRRIPTVFEDPGGLAIDHVLTDFASGRCRVMRDPRIDEGFDFLSLSTAGAYSGRIDHTAVRCDLYWP
jgi:hypothetical protein